ncbi:PREDICTED: Hermansky-Pudlak syndrome 5 protein homolog [Dinoponera quadriceps]|uniref:Hermansky-Pudlak syndrome 5 protein homolog n=1 Tax=Dinoponera quadriceps TaxID=609295 RepID=A0A6P3XG92_DINQU|nr:PREDICTED: Hermansky-Pudlak syndrome 5 protein homolog [Dinoponera quadriceps]
MESSHYRRCWTKMHCASLDLPYVLSECEEINSVLYKPINSTQRIKYSCFNVSLNYIILGSTSGSLYLFSRETCSFLQIIPLSEGAVTHVTISPDEKTIALTTTRDTVCLVFLKPTPRLMAVSTEHIHKQITCLCWNKNSTEVYIGDAVGRVSVMVSSIFTVNGMFQTRVYTLMNLDSGVVQLNFCSSMLLVSTITRCYICDTVREQYKQIGNKARNGEFGACFFEANTESGVTSDVETTPRNDSRRGTFSLISDSNISSENCPKIFCARPGSRLWEVSADGVVVKTHQLREALAMPPRLIFRPGSGAEEQQTEWPAQSVNFSHLFVIARKYLLSHTSGGLYVVDPASASVLLWNNEFASISMIAVAGDKIYLMTGDGEFHCLTLSSIGALILRLYRREEYRACLDACTLYRRHLSSIAKREMIELLDSEEEALRPLMALLRSGGRPAKLNSVHRENDIDERARCETSPSSEEKTVASSDSTSSESDNGLRCDLDPVYALANSIRAGLSEAEVEGILSEIDGRIRAIKESYKDSHEVTRAAELHCYNSFLENTPVQVLRSTGNDRVVRQFVRAFVDINAPSYARCGCGYPCPMNRNAAEPKFLPIGRTLIARFADHQPEECGNICDRVPYMWREYLAVRLQRRDALDDVLRQCLQTGDNVVLSFLLPALNEQQWSCVAACVSEIENGTCLFCATPLADKPDVSIDWTGIARQVMAREGPDEATAFLIRLQSMMPDIPLPDKTIFQSIVFTKILHHHGLRTSFTPSNQLSADFGTMCSSQVRDQLAKALEKDTRRPTDTSMFGTAAHHWGMRHRTKSLTCPCCTLSLQTPILLGNKGVAIFRCGHAYHVNCMIERKLTRCNLHHIVNTSQ